MAYAPLEKMWERVETARQDSDTALFYSLLYTGEMIVKTIAAGLIAAISDDPDRNRYRQIHRLVRADGIGEWVASIDEVLIGPGSQHLVESARQEQKELTQRAGPGSWQNESAALLDACIRRLEKGREGIDFKLDARKWLAWFSELRNRTRGHGAPSSTTCGAISPDLEKSIRLFSENFSLFKREWAFLHCNLSGKYRITKLGHECVSFERLKKAHRPAEWGKPGDGVYIFFDKPYLAELIRSDAEAIDFFYPNGAFDGKKFELLSYFSDNRLEGDASPYLLPATDLPQSETQGIGRLEVQGICFGNLPPVPRGYINRNALEGELQARLADDRHPIITLVGRGGIGKTSLALSVLHAISKIDRFLTLLWFSARDIDLLPEGPKLVRPHLLSQDDIAREFVRLTEPSDAESKGFKPIKHFADALVKSPFGTPLLFVFDNFETAKSPAELFTWLDTYIRSPNKILLTTRFREFKGDFPVEVHGMTDEESNLLMDSTALHLGIQKLVSEEYKRQIFEESDGHPYVIKVLLGEVAKAGKLAKIERIVAGKEEILEALFERTYSGLSPLAKEVFLTLCNWRSTVPQIAVEAVMLKLNNERLDIDKAIEELQRSSFIDVTVSEEDKELFLTVPLVASLFGRKKLEVSPAKTSVQANTELLLYFGAGQSAGIRHGVGPRVQRLFANIADKASQNTGTLYEYRPMLEFVAQRHSPAWLLLASLYEESTTEDGVDSAKYAIRRYLETSSDPGDKLTAWERLGNLCRRTGDLVGELHALVEICALPGSPFAVISNALNRWNWLFKFQYIPIGRDERRLLADRLLSLVEKRKEEADATDCSRIAWLSLSLDKEESAAEFTRRGLILDTHNTYCRNLLKQPAINRRLFGQFT